MHGLKPHIIKAINEVFAHHPEVGLVVLYGSRAMGNYKTGSDVDLTLKGENLNLTLLQKIENDLDELYLPYKIDLSIYNQISNSDLREHIDRVGRVFYEKEGEKA
jgi:uncharacterized protein